MDAPPIVDIAQKVLLLNWTQVSVIIGALVCALGALAYALIWWGRQRELSCEERVKASQASLVEVLKGECQKSTIALDKSTAAIESNTKSTDRLCEAIDHWKARV